jgi:hypothetical protein
MDSDWMLTKPTTPKDFQTNGKYHWFYRDWTRAGKAIQWKSGVEKILQETAPYEAMVTAGFVLTRLTSLAFKNHICTKHATREIWDVIVNANAGKISEFNMFGNFIFLYAKSDYECLINVAPASYHNQSIHASWSWSGGIDEKDRIYRNRILS